MRYRIRTFYDLSLHPDYRWDSEYLCFEPYTSGSLQYVPIGDTLASSQYGASIEMNEDGIGTKVYRMNEISGILCDSSVSKYAELDADDIDAYKLHDRDVLFNRTNSQSFVGRTGIFRALSEENIAFASYLIRLVPKPEIITPEYLTAFLNTKYGVLDVKRRARISINQSNVNAEELKRVEIPLVCNELQLRVTRLFDRAFNLVQASETEHQQAEAQILSELGLANWQPKHKLSFVKNFSDTRHTGRIDADYFQPQYEEIVAAIKSYPGGWDTLGNLTTIKKGFEVGSEEYLEEGIPFVRVSNLSPFEITEEKYISKRLYAMIQGFQPEQGEILLSKDATPGIAHYLDEPPPRMIPASGVLRLKSKTDKVNDECLALILNSMLTKKQANRDVGGSVIVHWRPEQIAETVVPILSPETQNQIRQMVTESASLRRQSKRLLECAKRAVELAIEQDEQTAIAWLDSETNTQSHHGQIWPEGA